MSQCPTVLLNFSTSLSALAAWRDDALGAIPPVGYFDPLGLSNGKDDATMNLYREVRVKVK